MTIKIWKGMSIFILLLPTIFLPCLAHSLEETYSDSTPPTIPYSLDGNALVLNTNFRFPLVYEDKKFAVFWSQRAGCTTIKSWFLSLLGYENIDIENNIHSFYRQITNETYKKSKISSHPELYTKVAVVRNPYARILASFRYAVSVSPEFKKAMESKFKLKNNSSILNKISFLDFIEFLEQQDITNPKTDGHWAQQTDLRYWHIIDHIVHLENFAEEILPICKNLEFDPKNEFFHLHLNSQFKTDEEFGITFEHFTYNELINYFQKDDGKVYWPQYKYFMPPDVKAKIDKIYQRDIQILGYPFEE